MTKIENIRIGVVGLGYVGLPLALLLAKRFPVVGFDVNNTRIGELRAGHDRTREVEPGELAASSITFSSDLDELRNCNFYIVAVPTPIDNAKRPDMSIVLAASKTVGKVLANGDVVVYESTVYPGATEEDCVPVLEAQSGLSFNNEFFVGYSPERVNPGDKLHTIDKIVKVTSGSTPETADLVDAVYASVVTAGTFRAASIRIAEAAKVIENTQRDVNIALVNELSLLFERLDIDTLSVLEAAGTKWNFLPFRPGLVGGHCIGVDPYYLTHKAIQVGYHPEVILAGRRINDDMGLVAATRLIKAMAKRGAVGLQTRVAVLGLTFKENCPDIRNTRVVDIIAELEQYGITVDIHDPYADADEARHEYGVSIRSELDKAVYSGVMVAVPHDHYKQAGISWVRELLAPDGVVFDLKGAFALADSDMRL